MDNKLYIIGLIALLSIGYGSTEFLEFILPSGDVCYYTSQLYPENCFTLSTKTLSWNDANNVCQSFYGTLVDKEGESATNFIKELLMLRSFDKIWLAGHKESTSWQWSDGEDIDLSQFQPWNQALPFTAENEDCLQIVPSENYTWKGTSCGKNVGYICESDYGSELCSTASKIFYEVFISDNRCFMISSYDNLHNWFNSKQECSRYGAKLAEINNELIHEQLLSIQPGLKQSVQGYWIGASKARWIWDKGRPISKYNWQNSQPNRSADCMIMERFDNSMYKWADWDCSSNLHYICQYNMSNVWSHTQEQSTNNDQEFAKEHPSTALTDLTTDAYNSNAIENTVVSTNLISTTLQSSLDKYSTLPAAKSSIKTTTSKAPVLTMSTQQTTPIIGLNTVTVNQQPKFPCLKIDLCWNIPDFFKINQSNRIKLMHFMIEITNRLTISEQCFQIATVIGGRGVENIIDFTKLHSREGVLEMISKLSQLQGVSTNSSLASTLEYTHAHIFDNDKQYRISSKQLSISILASNSSQLVDNHVLSSAKAAKAKYIGISFIILNNNRILQLNNLSAQPSAIYQIYADSFNTLARTDTFQNLLLMMQVFSESSQNTQTIVSSTLAAETGSDPITTTAPSDNTVLIILLTVIITLVILITITGVCICMLIIRRKRRILNKLMHTTTLMGQKDGSRYEEVSVHSGASSMHSSVRSAVSHGSSRQKIERARRTRHKSDPFPTQQQSGGITTPWGSMNSGKVRGQTRLPISNMAVALNI